MKDEIRMISCGNVGQGLGKEVSGETQVDSLQNNVKIIVRVEEGKYDLVEFILPNQKLKWRENFYECVLTLDEIREQVTQLYMYKVKSIIVWVDSPLTGWIYKYGNSGWCLIGKTMGFA